MRDFFRERRVKNNRKENQINAPRKVGRKGKLLGVRIQLLKIYFTNHGSCECVKSELDLLALPPTQTSIEHGDWVQYKPLASLTDDSPIEFVVPGHGDEYIDLSLTMLNIQARILKSDGTKIEDSVKVGPVNNRLHSLFSQVDVYLNQRLVSSAGNTYAYRSYIETLLNYGPAAKGSHLTSSLWYNDESGNMDNTEDENDGLVN